MAEQETIADSAPVLSLSAPRWIFLQLLENCNLSCKMCYEWGENGAYHKLPVTRRLDIDKVRQLIEDCKHVQPYYELFGGEPLLYPEFEEVLKLIHESGSKVHLPTNGTLLERNAEALVKYPPERVWVSIDGPPEINDIQRGIGVFEQAISGIETIYKLRESRGQQYPHLGVNLVVTPGNHKHIERLFFEHLDLSMIDCFSIELQTYLREEDHADYEKVLKEEFAVEGAPIAKGWVGDISQFEGMDLAAIESQVNRLVQYCEESGKYLNLYPQNFNEEDIRKFYSADWFSMSKVKQRCSFPWISTEISARGDVTSCHAFYDLSLGNLYEQSIVDIWNGDKYRKYRNYLKKNLLPICQACCLFYNEKPQM